MLKYQSSEFYLKISVKGINTSQVANQSISGGKTNMISILFVCHGTTADSRDLSALVGQNGAKCGFWDDGVLRFYYD